MVRWDKFRKVCAGLATLHAATVAFFSLAPVTIPVPLEPTLRQMLLHMLGYGILTLLVSGAWLPTSPHVLSGITMKAGILSFSYGAVLEGIQAFLPWRFFEWWDLAFNGVGAIGGILVFYIIFRRLMPLS